MAVKKTVPKVPTIEDFIYEFSPGVLKKGTKVLNDSEFNSIIILAKELSNNILLVDLIKHIEADAAKKIYIESKDFNDVSFGKGMIAAMSLLKEKIVNASKMGQKRKAPDTRLRNKNP